VRCITSGCRLTGVNECVVVGRVVRALAVAARAVVAAARSRHHAQITLSTQHRHTTTCCHSSSHAYQLLVLLSGSWENLRGAKRTMPTQKKLAPNTFQERPPGVSRMQENLSAVGSLSRTPLRELTALPKTHMRMGRGWLSFPKNIHVCSEARQRF